jgi:hypothetical protein
VTVVEQWNGARAVEPRVVVDEDVTW